MKYLLLIASLIFSQLSYTSELARTSNTKEHKMILRRSQPKNVVQEIEGRLATVQSNKTRLFEIKDGPGWCALCNVHREYLQTHKKSQKHIDNLNKSSLASWDMYAYPCRICKIGFHKKDALIQHKEDRHTTLLVNTDKPEEGAIEQPEKELPLNEEIIPQRIPIQSKTKETLMQHQEDVHTIQLVSADESEDNLIEQQPIEEEKQISLHEEIIPQRIISTRSQVIDNSEPFDYQCTICSAHFSHMYELAEHKVPGHTKSCKRLPSI